MNLSKIDRQSLGELHDLLNLSAGYEVSLEDELNYFDPDGAKSWFLARGHSERPLGFVRNIRQGTDWSQGELYVMPGVSARQSVAVALVTFFQQAARFPVNHRLRFELPKHDSELNAAIEGAGFSERQQTFLHFEMILTSSESKVLESNRPGVERAAVVAEVLSHLNPVTADEAREWILNDSIRTSPSCSNVASAAQILESDDAYEINRIATLPESLRQGHAANLMRSIVAEAAAKGKSRVYLKVEDIRTPAIQLYKKVGFSELRDRAQTWHSRWY